MSVCSKKKFESELYSWLTSGSPSNQYGRKVAAGKITIAFETSASELNLEALRIGDLSKCIGNCTSLTSLSLMGNELTQLPDELAQLSNLEVLDVTYNLNLQKLPENLAKIPSLKHILTGSTKISRSELCDIQSRNQSLRVQDLRRKSRENLLKEKLLFSQRPLEVQQKVDEVYNSLTKKTINWQYDGRFGFYNLFSFKDEDIIAQRIENASLNKKDLSTGQKILETR